MKCNLKKDTTVPIKILMRKKNENYPEIQDYFFPEALRQPLKNKENKIRNTKVI